VKPGRGHAPPTDSGASLTRTLQPESDRRPPVAFPGEEGEEGAPRVTLEGPGELFVIIAQRNSQLQVNRVWMAAGQTSVGEGDW